MIHRSDNAPEWFPARARRPMALLGVLCWFYVLLTLLKHGIYRPIVTPGVDYGKHWLAARALLEGRSIYEDPGLWLSFNYPQATALPFFWLGYMDEETAGHAWDAALLLFILAAWFAAARLFRPEAEMVRSAAARSGAAGFVRAAAGHWWGLTAALVLGFYSPAGPASISIGQVDPVNAMLAVALGGAVLRGRDRAAGVLWTALCLVKVFPFVLAAPFALWGRWRILAWSAGAHAAYLLLLAALGRLGDEGVFYFKMAPEIGYFWRHISISIHRMALVALHGHDGFENPVLYRRFTEGFTAGTALLLCAVLAEFRRRGRGLVRALETAFIALPLLSPLLESHHAVWSLPALFLQLRRWIAGELRALPAALLALGWTAVCMDYFLRNHFEKHHPWVHFQMAFALLFLTAATVFETFARTAPSAGDTPADP